MKVKKPKSDKRISLDTEVVADLEATDADTGAIQGGGRGTSYARSSGGGGGGGTGT